MRNTLALTGTLMLGMTLAANSYAQNQAAHEHGKAQLNVALQGSVFEIELTSPADSFWGFEYAAKTSEEKLAEQKALVLLKSGDWLGLTGAAGCRLKTGSAARSEESMHDHDHEHEQHHEHDQEHAAEQPHKTSTHTDVEVRLTFDCAKPAALLEAQAVKIRLFQQFANLSKVNLQGITDAGQIAMVLTAETTQFGLSVD